MSIQSKESQYPNRLLLQSRQLVLILSIRSKRVENSGNKLKSFAAKKGLIIGGRDTCQGDSGGPLWVEENGKVESWSQQEPLTNPHVAGNISGAGQ